MTAYQHAFNWAYADGARDTTIAECYAVWYVDFYADDIAADSPYLNHRDTWQEFLRIHPVWAEEGYS
jgi:hypothetical protein